MLDSTNVATFGEGTIQDVANLRMDVILDRLRQDELELSPYAEDRRTAIVYTLAFGGPAAQLTILYSEDEDPIGGFYEYAEASGSASVPIGKRDAEAFHELLTRN